jgi:O-antigen/teichoic acid export membrane protein
MSMRRSSLGLCSKLLLKKNIVSNYFGQAYVACVNIAFVPVYVNYIGAEAYGLVGFYAMLQSWFSLLDMGLSPTLGREAARHSAGRISSGDLKRLLRILQYVFIVVALGAAGLVVIMSEAISSRWLSFELLAREEVSEAIILMALIAALRWMGGLYRGAIIGLEHIVWINVFQGLIATIRCVGVIPVLIYVSATPRSFFGFQLLVAATEAGGLAFKAYSSISGTVAENSSCSPHYLRGVIKFSLGLTVSSTVGVALTQLDKILLSKMLPLSIYGQYTIAVIAASSISLATSAMTGALIPRLTNLSAQGNDSELLVLYRNMSQVVSVVAFSGAAMCLFFSEPLLAVWTSNTELASAAAPILILYACGNSILAVSAFPYYLQLAKGDIKLHIIGNVIFVAALLPGIFLATNRFGAVGAGAAWLIGNSLYFLCWTPLVHNRLAPALHKKWLFDIFCISIVSLIAAKVFSGLFEIPSNRWIAGGYLAVIGGIVGLCSASASVFARQQISSWLANMLGLARKKVFG